MPGDIKLQYGTDVALAQTNLDGIASSATWVAGWTSDAINNTSTEAVDYLITGQLQAESAGLSAGVILVMVYASLSDTPTWPDLFSAGLEGVEGTATLHDTAVRDTLKVGASIVTNTTGSRIYPFAFSVAQLFGGVVPPYFAIFIAQGTGTTLETTGDPNVVHYMPIFQQYT